MRPKRTIPPPWVALGISRATWYRHGKPTTGRRRLKQAESARRHDASLRSLQRAGRILREAPDLGTQVEAGTLKIGTAERLLIERQQAALLAWFRAELERS